MTPDIDAMRQWRHDLHQHPETGFDLPRTSAFVAEKLRGWGYEVTEGLGGCGVVARLTVGDPDKGPRIAMRADMDALPMEENTGLPYASVHPGKMHACGHDGHTAMLLGGAELTARLARTGDLTGNGTAIFVFQPAEEVGGAASGAPSMIADGLFDRFPCDEIYGIHNGPTEAEGLFYLTEGPFMPSSDQVQVTFHGKPSHAAMPHLAHDTGKALAGSVLALHSIAAQDIDPMDFGLISIGCFSAGEIFNIIPGKAQLTLNLRSMRREVADRMVARIRTIVEAQAASYDCTAEVTFEQGYPAVSNTPSAIASAAAVAEGLVGADRVHLNELRVPASEDFAFYLQERPGCFFVIGNGDNGHADGVPIGPCTVHNPHYDFNDNNLGLGATFWATLIREKFQQEKTQQGA